MEPVRRKALVDATLRAVGDHGSLTVTMSEIARHAGVSPALAHHYFGSKEQLVIEARRRMENGTAFLTSCLADFFNTVPHKTTKTTEKYRLLSGTLTLKKGTVKATVDDSKLVPWLRENGYGDLVKVEESAKWGELKKLLAYTGEIATIQSTGEIVEGVTAYETPATFTVDI